MDKPYKSLKTSSNEIELGEEFPQNRFNKEVNFYHIGTTLRYDFTDTWRQKYLLAEIELVQVEPESRETFDLQWLQHFTCSPFQNFSPRLTLFSGPPSPRKSYITAHKMPLTFFFKYFATPAKA